MSDTLVKQIQELKKQRNAAILVHSYQPPEVQDIADVLGDSLDLSRRAAESSADVIVFCGVHFMAETASILCPDKKILLPDPDAGCPMADMVSAAQVRELKRRHPGVPVVAYVNTTAEVKTEIDVCCTSANAMEVVSRIPGDTVIFVPDKNLGQHVARQTGKKLIYVEGYCHVHARILAEHIEQARREHPAAEVIAHPECSPEVLARADRVLSTSGMCAHAQTGAAREFIVATETGLLHRLRRENPGKQFYPATELAVCANMKKTSLRKVLEALRTLQPEVRVSDDVRRKARRAIDGMLDARRGA
jgi:quinolinate synthase